MPKATWRGVVIAEAPADQCVTVEGNCYFPEDRVQRNLLSPSQTHTTCPWKGIASYYDVRVGSEVNPDAAWYYPDPSEAAKQIRGRIAFWKGVKVEP
ncbi:MAG TPA: DUF427 domain-containing protein [Myxococcales bacterium]|nr:DUF427 domain-containing protein [Myxococcales bacterium]